VSAVLALSVFDQNVFDRMLEVTSCPSLGRVRCLEEWVRVLTVRPHVKVPVLFMTSTRDMLLSDTTILHRAFLRTGVDASPVVCEV
jgi:hypothetical protein